MCGIAGANLSPNEKVNAKRVAKAMLLAIEHRGMDATGFAYRDRTGAIQVHKADIQASKFVKRNLCLDRGANGFIAHTRFATQGQPAWNENNHPIATGGIVGVHNGHVNNDDALFREIDAIVLGREPGTVRIAEVDSEAIFALLAYGQYDRVTEALEMVTGGAAVAWLDDADKENVLHLARLNSSPLICGETEGGSILFASTQQAVEAGARAGGMTLKMIRDIPEGTYMTVVDGEWDVVNTFEPAPYYRYTTMGTTTGSRYAVKGITDAMSQGGHWAKYGINDDEWDDYMFVGGEGSALRDDREWHPNTTAEERAYIQELEYEERFGERPATPIARVINIFGEEVEVIDPADDLDEDELDDPEAYAEWWRLNTMHLDQAIAKDDEADEAHKNFAAFQLAPKLNAYYIQDVEHLLQRPNEADYLADKAAVLREDNIRKWMQGFNVTGDHLATACHNLKTDARPGDTVVIDLDGIEVYGHIYVMPVTFPHGQYVIRAYLPKKNAKTGYEAIFLTRMYHEFETVQVVKAQKELTT